VSQGEARSSGLTLRAFGWIIFGLFLIAGVVQISGVFKGDGYALGGEVIPMPAFIVFGIWAGLGWIAKRLVGWRWLSSAEMVVVLYALMLATPLMSTGFWRMYLSTISTVPRFNVFDKYDALSPKSWPHGENLLEAKWESGEVGKEGNVEAATLETGTRHGGPGYILKNDAETTSAVSVEVPVFAGEELQMPLNEPYLVTALVRTIDLGPRSQYFVRLQPDGDAEKQVELIRSRSVGKKTPSQPEGFVRVSAYGVKLGSEMVEDSVTLIFGITGSGTLEVVDAEWINVSALEFAYTGRPSVSQAEYEALPVEERGAVVVVADSLLSPAGIKSALNAYVPWGEWTESFIYFGGYVFLLTLASLAIACLLRRQWMQSERFSLPLIYGPLSLVDGAKPWHKGTPYQKRPVFWIGFGIFLFWCILMGLSFYNSSIPSLQINVPLRSYFTDPAWMKVWGISFTVLPLALAIALFFEINILTSLLVGFFLFRFQFMVGEWTGWSVDQKYPYPEKQSGGAFLMYFIVIIWLARRFLGKTFQAAWKGESTDREMLSPRGSLILLLISMVGVVVWGIWAEINPWAPFALMLLFLVLMVVAMRIRTEIGMTAPSLIKFRSDTAVVILVAFAGSFTVFGTEGVVLACLMASITTQTFFLIPGMQMEMVEAGSRTGVKGRSIIGGAIVGVVAGMVIGGWIYLSGAYAVGADNFPIPGQFQGRPQMFNEYNSAVGFYTEAAKNDTSPWAAQWISPEGAAMAFGGLGTLGLFLIRQAFAGFWFHPAGFVLGPSGMLEQTWGALAMALLIRFLVLRLGGAAAVREKLFPFAAGAITGVAAAMFIFLIDQVYRYLFNPTNLKFPMQF